MCRIQNKKVNKNELIYKVKTDSQTEVGWRDSWGVWD